MISEGFCLTKLQYSHILLISEHSEQRKKRSQSPKYAIFLVVAVYALDEYESTV